MSSNAMPRYSEFYSAYAAGRLDPGFALLVETQGALRADVREAVAASESIAGALLETSDVVELTPGAADRALALIDALAPDTPSAPPPQALDDGLEILPDQLRDFALAAAAARGWKMAAPGIRRLSLDVGSEAEVELYKIQPGAAVPRHTHAGSEYTLVVTGGFSDASGNYGPGDLAVKGPDDTHQPIGDPGEVCYALAVRDGGLRFTGVMGVIQRLLGA
ncbi:ChR family anti-sigma factor [Hyphomonas johnsonii MHS-2]|uniref:ChR family anti-sigma factor n=2 Tax=Hyphomonas johnsonii TaxID=81031 RepID=A0A059FPD6_9PROT|nr:ChR family anti-sigma factor [Hyphomonas johnsonii MHS-2]